MTSLRKYLAFISVAFLVVLAVSPVKDFFREWKWYQYEYNALVATLPQRVKPADIGLKQIWVQKLDRVDRCVTCHLGIKEPALKDAQEPFRTHPHIYHDIEEFGCTVCHEGQGVATEFKESIGNVKYWDKPILPKQYMEASCAKCHKEQNVPQAPVLTAGRQLIEESNCAGCHAIAGYEKRWVPPLDGIGGKANRAWIINWLKNPKQYFTQTRMPNFLLSDTSANTLADFLMSFTKISDAVSLDPLPSRLSAANDAEKAKLTELGSTRFREARCISCHAINGKGGTTANDLGKIASKVSEQWLYNYIKNPKRIMPGVTMPRFRFSEEELEGVVAYMESEFVDYDMPVPATIASDPAFYEKGLVLFKKNNCAGCHELSAVPKAVELAPELTFIGSKKSYEIDFGPTTIDKTLPEYLHTKLKSPRIFSPVMKMPDFQFTDDELQAITVALLGNTNDPIPDQFIVHAKPKSTFAPQGEFGALVNDLSCMGCHVMNGKGTLVATDLSTEASQAQQKWIEGYFKVPYSLRPILTERMPNFFLNDAEIKTLVDYMKKVFIADSLQHNVPMDAATLEKGKGLYFEKYGCQGCHQINSKGGYVGPALDKVGSRLTAGWIFHWLKNPQAFKPESIEPNDHLTDQEAETLTAYLMSLK